MNQQQPYNVLIIDSSEDRKNGMVNIFSNSAKVYAYNFRIKKIECESPNEPGYWDEAEEIPLMDLTLIHAGDKDLKDITSQKKRIWYGGHGADDTRVIENEPIISRPVLGENSFLTQDESKQLIDFATGKIDCPPCCSEYSQKERTFDQRHRFIEKLQIPTQYDWSQPLPRGLFLGYEKEWEQFSNSVQSLLGGENDLSPFNETFLQLLKKFIQDTIEKDS